MEAETKLSARFFVDLHEARTRPGFRFFVDLDQPRMANPPSQILGILLFLAIVLSILFQKAFPHLKI